MTKNSSRWEHLSPVAQQMLHSLDAQDGIGHSEHKVTHFLKEAGCPDIEPFRRFLVRYAGLKLNFIRSPNASEFLFGSIGKKVRVWYSKKKCQWGLLIGETSGGHVALNLNESGELYSAMSLHRTFRVTQAGSLDTFIEQCALIWDAHRRGMILDGVATSLEHGGSYLARRNGLVEVSRATDAFAKAWTGRDVCILSLPGFYRKWEVSAYWPRHDAELDQYWTRELSSLAGAT